MTELIPPSAADCLRHAASLLEERGSCKGDFVSKDGSMCERGALNVATGLVTYVESPSGWISNNLKTPWPCYKRAHQALNEVGGGVFHNDLPTTTHADRVFKLLQAATYAEKMGW